jgi:hypothetical protein
MSESANWDWDTKEKLIANINDWKKKFIDVRELTPSDDGEKIAAVVQPENGKFTTCVNGEAWEEIFERVYSLKFTSDNQLISLLYQNYVWSLAVDHDKWEETYDYLFNLTLTPDGKGIAVGIKTEPFISICFNKQAWENTYPDCRFLIMSPNGKSVASCVQIKPLKTLDIFGYQKGVWTIIVDGTPWENTFWTVWGPVFSPDSNHVAASVRTGFAQYNIAVDGKTWEKGPFGLVWEPIFKPNTNHVVAPVRTPKGTTLAMNGEPIWGFFPNVWRQNFSPDGEKIAAVVAPKFDVWTIAVDGTPWNTTFSDLVLTPVFSPDSKRVAAVVKDNNRWTVAVDGAPWGESVDNIWDPIFSPGSDIIVARAQRNRKYYLVVNGKIGKRGYDMLWDPVFSPDGEKLLIRVVDDGKYYRRVVPVNELM